MKVPVVSSVNNSSKKISNKKSDVSFHGRVDTEMRQILVDRTIFGVMAKSGYTTFYHEEPISSRVDELNRMVNIYRPYSWEQEHYGTPWGTMECTSFRELPSETMQKGWPQYVQNGRLRKSKHHGYNCIKPEPTGERIPDYIEKDEFRLSIPISYTSDGRPIYKTGETLYTEKSMYDHQTKDFNKYDESIKEDRTEIWEGAIGIIGKPLTREESLNDKLKKLSTLKSFYEKQKDDVDAKYKDDISTADRKAADAILESTKNYNRKIYKALSELNEIKNKKNVDVLKQIAKEQKDIKSEIKTIEYAKSTNKYLDVSTKEKYEEFLKSGKNDYKYDTIVSLPMGTVQLSRFYNKDTKDNKQGINDFKEKLEMIFSPEKRPLITDLMHTKSNEKNNFVTPNEDKYDSDYENPTFKLHR